MNNKITFSDGYYSYLYGRALSYTEDRKIQPFVLKPRYYVNYQANENGTHSKLNSIYNYSKASCMLKYGMKKKITSPHELNIGGNLGLL